MAKNNKLVSALKEYFGFETFKGNQEAIIENLLAERDTFVLMPTGGGKSLCYQLPARLMEGTAIVISPLIALMKNQVDAMRSYSEEDGIAHFMNSSLTKQAIEEVKRDVRSGRTKLLYVAPESRHTVSRSGDTISAPSTATSVPSSTASASVPSSRSPQRRRPRCSTISRRTSA